MEVQADFKESLRLPGEKNADFIIVGAHSSSGPSTVSSFSSGKPKTSLRTNAAHC